MELNTAIYGRKSVRKFKDTPISNEDWEKIIRAGVSAPSACNFRGWVFKELGIYDKVEIPHNGGADFISDSTKAIMVFYPKSANSVYHDDIQSASACIQNMILEAYSLGIGSCWICHLPPKKYIRKLLNVPKHYEVVACVVFGYPLYDYKKKVEKKELAEYYIFKQEGFDLMRILKKWYIKMPFRINFIEERFTKRF